MLKIIDNPEIWWPVTVAQPRSDGSGRMDKLRIEVLYRPLRRSEAAQLIPADKDDWSQAERDEYTLERISEHILDWRGDVDVDFSEDSLSIALDTPYIADALIRGLRECSEGGRAKN